MSGLRVEWGGRCWELGDGETLTFGRRRTCTIGLPPEDVGVSREAGELARSSGSWWLTNLSESRPFAVVDATGMSIPIAPRHRRALEGGRIEVVVEGLVRRYCLVVTADESPATPAVQNLTGVPTMAGLVRISDKDRLALIAMFSGYLESFPRHDPRPARYGDAAARLGWPATTLRKRVEYLRQRLTRAGVANMAGERALENLAQHVLATGVITREDLALLPPR